MAIDDNAEPKQKKGRARTLDDLNATKMMEKLWTHGEPFGLTADNFPEIPACFTEMILSLRLCEPSRRTVP